MSTPTSSRPQSGSEARTIERLIEELTDRVQAGESIDPEEILTRHPEHAERLRQLLPALEVLADLGRSAAPGALFGPEAGAEVGMLGDFRLLREIGRGGMGVVYEAEQVSLGRRVALKVLPFASAMDPRRLQRFKVEAQAAALLHHTHIVPVFSVGVERGVHYYVMQFIDGRSLAEVIRELRHRHRPQPRGVDRLSLDATALSAADELGQKPPSLARASPSLSWSSGSSITNRPFFEAVVRLGVQVAEALEFAHSLGVVHRDVKPANLLMDDRGDLWVTDFGLARFHADAGLTMTGDVLGTLRYMSPEQALASRAVIDHRTDIYSLGVTLYELLTLQPALVGGDRQELLRQIAFDEPAAPRKLNPSIPRELETIVLKAIAKDPADRYASAQDLVDDLNRFREHRPIRARRPTLVERTVKWSRRHTPVVTSVIVLLLMAVVGLAVATTLISRAHEATVSALDRERGQARIAKAAAAEALNMRLRAEENFDRALSAMNRLLLTVDPQSANAGATREAARRLVAMEAIRFYQILLDEAAAKPSRQIDRGAIYSYMGDVYHVLGDVPKVVETYEKAIADYERLAAESPGTSEYHRRVGQGNNLLGLALDDLGRRTEASERFRRAAKGYERAVQIEPDSKGGRLYLSWFLTSCPDPQFRDPARSARIARAQIEQDPELGGAWKNLGTALYRLGDHAGAIRALERSRALRSGGDSFEFFILAMAHWRLGAEERANSYYDQAVAWMEGSRPQHETLRMYQREAAALLGRREATKAETFDPGAVKPRGPD